MGGGVLFFRFLFFFFPYWNTTLGPWPCDDFFSIVLQGLVCVVLSPCCSGHHRGRVPLLKRGCFPVLDGPTLLFDCRRTTPGGVGSGNEQPCLWPQLGVGRPAGDPPAARPAVRTSSPAAPASRGWATERDKNERTLAPHQAHLPSNTPATVAQHPFPTPRQQWESGRVGGTRGTPAAAARAPPPPPPQTTPRPARPRR